MKLNDTCGNGNDSRFSFAFKGSVCTSGAGAGAPWRLWFVGRVDRPYGSGDCHRTRSSKGRSGIAVMHYALFIYVLPVNLQMFYALFMY